MLTAICSARMVSGYWKLYTDTTALLKKVREPDTAPYVTTATILVSVLALAGGATSSASSHVSVRFVGSHAGGVPVSGRMCLCCCPDD